MIYIFWCYLFIYESALNLDPFLTDRFYIAWVEDIKISTNLNDVIEAGLYNLQAPEVVPSLVLWMLNALTGASLPTAFLLMIPMFVVALLLFAESKKLHWFSLLAIVTLVYGYYGLILFNVTYRLAFAFMFFAMFLFLKSRRVRFSDLFLCLALLSHLSFLLAIPILYFYFQIFRGEPFLSINFYMMIYSVIIVVWMVLGVFVEPHLEWVQRINNKLGVVGIQVNLLLYMVLALVPVGHLAVSTYPRVLFLGMVIFLIGAFFLLGTSRLYMLLSLVCAFLYIFQPPTGKKKLVFAIFVIIPTSIFSVLKMGFLVV